MNPHRRLNARCVRPANWPHVLRVPTAYQQSQYQGGDYSPAHGFQAEAASGAGAHLEFGGVELLDDC